MFTPENKGFQYPNLLFQGSIFISSGDMLVPGRAISFFWTWISTSFNVLDDFGSCSHLDPFRCFLCHILFTELGLKNDHSPTWMQSWHLEICSWTKKTRHPVVPCKDQCLKPQRSAPGRTRGFWMSRENTPHHFFGFGVFPWLRWTKNPLAKARHSYLRHV